ncbi:MAG: carboxymuconolactone decarboxylase family protein [Microthrixaceae bacterium]|nr:carboxymuconolactone decarboxylase family protein [Microthrixaceae bacterium]
MTNEADHDRRSGQERERGTAAPGGTAGGDSAYERGSARIREVYAGNVVDLPEGTMAFNDVMMRSLFAEVWDRDVLTVDQRRLLIMGVIAARGQADTWRIQARAALDRGELDPDELRETLVMLAPYAGYPVVAPLVVPTEEVISEFERASDSRP